MKKTAIWFVLATLLSSTPLRAGQDVAVSRPTPLDAYVQAPDTHFHYELVQQTKHPGFTLYLLQMTSQKWRSADEVDRTSWQHWITIYKPQELRARRECYSSPDIPTMATARTPSSIQCLHRSQPRHTLWFLQCSMFQISRLLLQTMRMAHAVKMKSLPTPGNNTLKPEMRHGWHACL